MMPLRRLMSPMMVPWNSLGARTWGGRGWQQAGEAGVGERHQREHGAGWAVPGSHIPVGS